MADTLQQRAAVAPAAMPRRADVVTLGLEEELQVVDAHGALTPHDFARGQLEVPDADGTSSREIHRCVLEVKTPVCASADAIVASLAAMRRVAAARAQRQGQRVLAAGLHPFSRCPEQATWCDPAEFPRFVRLAHEYGDTVMGALAFGMHVHLGCTDAALRMPVMNALRDVLPDVLALAASSPFSEGRDTGLDSWRQRILARLPRSGIPEAWRDEASYLAHLDRLRAVGSLRANEGSWEDLRLHHAYGTLEVRICDAVPSLDRAWLIVALLQAEVVTLEDDCRHDRLPPPLDRLLIEDNKFRATRHGMRAELVDWRTGEPQAMPLRLQHWLRRIAPAAARLGTLARLTTALAAASREPASAQMQRAWRQSGGFERVVDELEACTAAPLSVALRPSAA